MGDYINDLNIVVSLIDRASKPIDIIREKLEGLDRVITRVENKKDPFKLMGDARVLSQIQRGNFDQPIMQFKRTIGESTEKMSLMDKAIRKATSHMEKLGGAVDVVKDNFREMQMRFLSGGLALLFTGMALERFFGGFLRSAFNTYTQLIDVNNQFFQKTQHLRAAWEFFKFALIDALGQSDLFLTLIDWVIAAINWFGQLSPTVLAAFALFLIGGLAASSAMVILGNAMLFVMGISGLFGISMGGALALILIPLGIIVFLFFSLFFILSSKMENAKKQTLLVVVAMGLLAATLFFTGVIGIAAFLGVITLLGILGVLLFVFWQDFIAGAKKIGLLLQIVWLEVKLAFVDMVDSAIEKLQELFNWIISKAPKLAEMLDLSPVAVRGPLTSTATALRSQIAGLQLEGLNIEKAQRESGREGFSAESLKAAFSEAFKDILPNFQEAVTEGVNKSNSVLTSVTGQ